MNRHASIRTIPLVFSAAILAVGCSASSPPSELGFLSDYSELRETSAPGGGTRLEYWNSAFTPARYTAVWLDPVVFYPQPQPSESVSLETLEQIRNSVNETLWRKVGEQVNLADRAGPGVARIRIAITAVGTEAQSLQAYQYIPIALVMTEARAEMQGGMPRDVTDAIEAKVTDSRSGELLYASVRGGAGERVANATRQWRSSAVNSAAAN